jgi:hypothetical protein
MANRTSHFLAPAKKEGEGPWFSAGLVVIIDPLFPPASFKHKIPAAREFGCTSYQG